MKTDLNEIRDELHTWAESLWVEEDDAGGFRMGADGQVNLLSATDMAWLKYAVVDLAGIDAGRRRKWTAWLKNRQNRSDGHYEYTAAVGEGNMHSNGHAFWHTARALGILGGEVAVFPKYLSDALTVDGLRNWFRAWERQANPTHHDVLGLIPLFANTQNAQWHAAFYAGLAGQQNPGNGAWPRNSPTNISRTFAYTVIYRATGKMPAYPEKLINTILALQNGDGFWRERNHSYFSTMDAIYVLARLPELVDHRKAEAEKALIKAKSAVTGLYRTGRRALRNNTHSMLAVVHALGLLAERFPDDFISSKPWRFDWDRPELFKSGILQWN